MARTVGHTMDRYVGHKLFLARKRDRKFGARKATKQALRAGKDPA